MNNQGEYYDYILVYINNLLIVSKDTDYLIIIITNKYKFKLKGTSTIKYYL